MKDEDKTKEQLVNELIELRSIFENAVEGIFQTSVEGRILEANPALAHMLGYSSVEELIAEVIEVQQLYIYPSRREEFIDLMQTKANGIVTGFENQVRRKDGSKIWVSVNVRALRDSNGRLIGFEGMAIDITERKRAEVALQESEIRFRSVEQSATDAIISADSTGYIISWNKSAQTIFGYTEGEAVGKPLIILMPERYRDAHQRGLERIKSTGETRIVGKIVELAGLRKDGSEFPLELSLSTWKIGERRFYTGIIRDITERKRAEEAMSKKTQELSALYTVAKTVSQSLNLDEMQSGTLETVLQIMGADAGGINLIEEDSNLHLKVHKGLSQKFVNAIKTIKVGVGVSGLAVELRKPIAIDISQHPNAGFIPVLQEEGVKSLASTPIIFKDKVLGTINIHYRRSHTFSQDELDIFASIGNELGVAIENAILLSELERHDKTIEALYAIDRVVSQTLDMDTIFRDALTKSMEITETDSGGILLLEEDGETLSLRAHQGLSQEYARAMSKIKVGQGVTGMAAKSGKPVTLDITKYPSPELLPFVVKEGQVSFVGVPLIAKGKVVGAMGLAYKSPRFISQDYLDLLASIGSQIGAAVENAKLFSELEKHHKMLEALYTIESVVSRSLNLEEIFNVALSKALEVTETEAGTLYSMNGDVLNLKAVVGFSPEFKEKANIRKIGEGIPGIAAQLKKPVTMDISQFPSPHLLPYVMQEGLVSFIGTPLMSKEKVVGAMALGTKKKRIFTQDDLDLLFSIGNEIGIAMENAQLYKESEENLQKLQKAYEELQTLDKMKDEFIANVSHELKTPLISIKGYGELLYDEKLDGLSGKQKKGLEAILRNADRLTRLINSILLIGKLQTGKIEFHFKPLDLDETVRVCVSDFKSMIDEKKITFEKHIPAISKVKVDRDRFLEVMNNLLDNAIKFTPEKGKISIRAWDEAENVHITVSDSGVGIPSDVIPKLFARFYQLDASTARKYGGTGLGLYITKNIIDAFGGKIWIESEVGKGTTVHILLPIAKEEGSLR